MYFVGGLDEVFDIFVEQVDVGYCVFGEVLFEVEIDIGCVDWIQVRIVVGDGVCVVGYSYGCIGCQVVQFWLVYYFGCVELDQEIWCDFCYQVE